MTMNYEQWKRTLSAVNEKEDLSKDNVIEKIKEELKAEGKGEYEKWEGASFDVDYLFEIEDDTLDDTLIAYDRFMLLHSAAKNGHADVVNALIQNGANVNAEDNFKSTPLYDAANKGYIEIVNALIQNGANVNAEDNFKSTPLHNAADKGYIEIVNALIDREADVNAEDNFKSTPLHNAARNGHIDTVKVLIAKRADVNAKDIDGYTPLHWATRNGHTEIVRILIAYCLTIWSNCYLDSSVTR
ncbi:ankyrin repeat domain-containing protein [Wolbachia endosymbiont (group A) of Pogonocherus hispidulus]|uniref:ankyrin repeat domain-containing protein n=1 Tax=Wolbachia endosymbiont (group A) of Pogonocherus hispidulus TaxID=3066136 RepID=UPI00333F4448